MPDNSKSSTLSRQSKKSALSGIPSKLEMEAYLEKFGHSDQLEEQLREAQELVYDAWETRDGRSRYALVKKALKISPLCADAFVVLAERPSLSSCDRLDLFERGVHAGELALGPSAFEEYKEHFWGYLETRPYMRARHGLAVALWIEGRPTEAIEHLQEMLMLNPNDNQGLRYLLLEWLLRTGKEAEVEDLLKEYGDEYSAFMAYTCTLCEFRKAGGSTKAQKLALAAFETNKYVPLFLSSLKAAPKSDGDYYSPGQESEATLYLEQYGFAWQETSGAIDWLVDLIPASKFPELI